MVKANFIARPELVGDFDAVNKCYGDYIKKIRKNRKISEVKNRDNRGDDGHQGDGGGKRRGGRGGGSRTRRCSGGNNCGEKRSRKEIDDCTHIKDQYVTKPVYKDYYMAKRSKLYELRLAHLDKEVPQGDRKKYVHNIKSLQRQLDEARMGNDDPSDYESYLYDSSHVHFEGGELDAKDNKNRVCQGGPLKRNKIKKRYNETLTSEHVRATLYDSMATVAAVCTMLIWEPVPTASTCVITSVISKVLCLSGNQYLRLQPVSLNM